MKLSEAIYEGAKTTAPCTQAFFRKTEGAYHTCALGAALYAVGYRIPVGVTHFIASFGLDLEEISVVHPVTKDSEPLYGVVTDLNDHHGWTREQIADWLQELGY
jgi:hypothetical protein